MTYQKTYTHDFLYHNFSPKDDLLFFQGIFGAPLPVLTHTAAVTEAVSL